MIRRYEEMFWKTSLKLKQTQDNKKPHRCCAICKKWK